MEQEHSDKLEVGSQIIQVRSQGGYKGSETHEQKRINVDALFVLLLGGKADNNNVSSVLFIPKWEVFFCPHQRTDAPTRILVNFLRGDTKFESSTERFGARSTNPALKVQQV